MLGGVDGIAKEKKRERKILYNTQHRNYYLYHPSLPFHVTAATAARNVWYVCCFVSMFHEQRLSLTCVYLCLLYEFSGDAAFPFSLLCLLNGEKIFYFGANIWVLKRLVHSPEAFCLDLSNLRPGIEKSSQEHLKIILWII